MRICFIHDWLLGMRGGEKCLEAMLESYPDSEVFTGFLDKGNLSSNLQKYRITSSSFNSLPGVKKYYRYLLPLFPLLAEDLGRAIQKRHKEEPFDAVVSISHCFAKNVPVPSNLKHVCYCLTPMRYLYDQFDNYFGKSLKGKLASPIFNILRKWDKRGTKRVHKFISISKFIQDRISRVYEVQSEVVYPPVEVLKISERTSAKKEPKKDYFLAVGALVPYKNTRYLVDAFNELGSRLVVVGDGPELAGLKSVSKGNIEYLGWVTDSELLELYQGARALLFAAEEDFGIVPVESQAAGTPVIALGLGGALETILSSEDSQKRSGVFYRRCEVDSIKCAVKDFIAEEDQFLPEACIENAMNFSSEIFNRKIQETFQKALTN